MKNGDTSLHERISELEQVIREKDDVLQHKDRVIREQECVLQESKDVATRLETRNNQLEEMVRLLRAQQYAPRSEKSRYHNVDQQELKFDEIETLDAEPEPEEEPTTVKEHSRKKRGGGRKPLPEDLPREDVYLDISDEEKQCACGHQLEQIGEDVSEKLEVIPAKVYVIRTHRAKYACKHCEGVESENGTVLIAPQPAQILPKSIATSGLIAQIVTHKFVDGLPLYRQSKMYARLKIDIPDKKMSRWLVQVYERCKPLQQQLARSLLESDFVGIDETPVQVLKEPGRSNRTKSQMWVFRGGSPDKPLLLYHYSPTREKSVPITLLDGYQGYIQTDGYAGYDALGNKKGVIHVGCWVHARRKFDEVLKSLSPKKRKKGSIAVKALKHISKIYEIERHGRELSNGELTELRQSKTVPVLSELHGLLMAEIKNVPEKSKLGEAIAYTLGQWDKLERFILNPRITPDNNLVENAIRPFVVGRKNWLFSGSPRGADASAFFYSLVETAKACGLEPYAYLRFLFERIPRADSEEDFNVLLPMNIKKDQITL